MISLKQKTILVVGLLIGVTLYMAFLTWQGQLEEEHHALQTHLREIIRKNKKMETSLADVKTTSMPPVGKKIPHGPPLHLTSVVYTDDEHWTIWINGRSIHENEDPELGPFELHSVEEEGVFFSYQPEGLLQPVNFQLKPGQTYVSSQGRVINEDAREF